ncbi:DENN domain-containing protein 1A isoform X4 [Hypomesus transpacificus]|uniref:DENN domain-containing protein 1A isoform X4 n=1 Tax=Hypomesus transpacificus TaxID=137520 RepID=UPI001F07A93A|nr:DENN domain-containing protein 1A isoform X4 [Hypomesus transpacificus]
MGSRIKESPQSTFEVYVEVTHPGTVGTDPEVRRRFPEDYIDQETLQTVPKFCFPFSADSLSVSQVGQNFTFVLTDIESKQRFGFCRLSSGAHSCYCILSYLPWFEVFYKLLNILADYSVKAQESQWRELLESLHTLTVPDPGVPVHLSVHSYFTVPDTRGLPSIPENRNLTEYFVAVDVNNMLHLYASMLYERRILICCSKLSTLTACVHGSAAMLYPMYWQHVYIPVLPQHLIDYCCAPMPYLIGVHSSLMEKVRGMALDDVVVLNVDTNTLETPFDDLQGLPNDVVSSLKNRLKKVSTTTGDGVARAFLKTQAALFGSYRNALQFEPGEPITFSEETFVTHRSSAMKQFLQNAIQLQLFKQFIDGRLDLLNAGEGFSDDFEEEINMGEYAGSDKTYHQWLFTVKKGGGAIFNTVRTKANPAMKTVYKFAKDHAKMGIKEVKSRLKQKELTENGYSSAAGPGGGDGTAGSPPSTTDRKEASHTWDDRRPITVHFGQIRPPKPLVVKRPRSNVGAENSPDQPQPYRSLKEAQLTEGGESGIGVESQTAPPSPLTEKFTDINLLGDIFSCQDEPESQSLAKSLEDLRTFKEAEKLEAKFNYQRMDLKGNERTRTLPGLKHSNPYNKLWSLGQDDMAVPGMTSSHLDRPLSVPPLDLQEPASHESLGLVYPEQMDPSTTPNQGSITIPRPQGRKTPEPGKVLAPPVPQPRSKPSGEGEGGTTVGAQEFRQALGMSSGGDLLKPTKVNDEDLDLLSLLDPLNSTAWTPSVAAAAAERGGDPGALPNPSSNLVQSPQPFPHPPFPPQSQMSLNPFSQSLHYPPTHRHYTSSMGRNPFCSPYGPPGGAYFQRSPHPNPLSTLQGLYRQPSPAGTSTLPPRLQPAFPQSASPLPPSSVSSNTLSSLLDLPSAPTPAPRVLPKPPNAEVDSRETPDPFGDLLILAKPVTPSTKKPEDLRRRWETFD